jgi:hypothetical protein
MDKKDSERERLLRLIDSGEKGVDASKHERHAPEHALKISKGSSHAGAKALSFSLGAHGAMSSGMSLVAKSLGVVLVLVIGYGIVDLLAYLMITKTPSPVTATAPVWTPHQPSAPLAPVSPYEDKFAKSDVFNPLRISEVPAEIPVEQEGVTGPLKLVGIDWDEEPVAMLEDTQSGKTYFAKKDTSIKDIKVLNIQQDRVTISRGNMIAEIK